MMRARVDRARERAVVPAAESNRAHGRRRPRPRSTSRSSSSRNAIAALVGPGPDRGRAISLPAAARLHAFGLPAGLGIDIVGRRPDIVAARLRAEAQAERIHAARAEFYPNVSLSALVGLQSLGIGNLLQGGSVFGSAGPAICCRSSRAAAIEGNYRGTPRPITTPPSPSTTTR